ncbi:MAG TPA: helix-turn-helix transcriptional regulator [Gemmataceae bacterium]|jgi:transcriptional regulator with XRE-family HTH domain
MKKETFGERLQRLRSESGLTQQQVSDRAGVPLQTLRNWEHDRREPLTSALFKLADALGVDCSAFKGCVDAEPPPSKKGKKRKERE